MPEPPYLEIADSLREGNVVPFLGAGVNFGTRPTNESWQDPQSAFLPTAAELSGYLAHRASFPSDDVRERGDLAKVASYFVIPWPGALCVLACMEFLPESISPRRSTPILPESPGNLMRTLKKG